MTEEEPLVGGSFGLKHLVLATYNVGGLNMTETQGQVIIYLMSVGLLPLSIIGWSKVTDNKVGAIIQGIVGYVMCMIFAYLIKHP